MKVAYADPPYIGQARKHYQCDEINHALLIKDLERYDSWALSCSSPSLGLILNLCPKDVRVMAWVKPFCSFKPNVNPAYAWEPVIVKLSGERSRSRTEKTIRDWVSCNITLKKGLCGAKPEAFCFWLFSVLNMNPTDEFCDLFPGTFAVTNAWIKWKSMNI